jgi:hypothetical protein
MAVALLLEGHPKAMQELFLLKLNALGIRDTKDLAFILGSDSDAEKAAQDIFGGDNSEHST